MAIEGWFAGTHRRPLVRARIIIRRLAVESEIDLLVDTGADTSILLERDGQALGIDYSRLTASRRIGGIGGVGRASSEPAILVFREKEPSRVHVYRMSLVVAHPPASSVGLPSLLGRDILNRWHMNYRPTENLLAFDVVDADESLDLDA